MPEDYLAIDKEGEVETQKISKKDFLKGYLQNPELEQQYPDSTWARRNKSWVEIFPDKYITKNPKDGKKYVRQNDDWVPIKGGALGRFYIDYDINGELTLFEDIEE